MNLKDRMRDQITIALYTRFMILVNFYKQFVSYVLIFKLYNGSLNY